MNQALRECDKLIRKHAMHPGAQALKAFVLARQGEVKQATTLAHQVLKAPGAVKSPHVQQGLSLAFRALGLPEDEIAVYTAALKHSSDAESLHCKIFMTAARNKMLKEQHATAVVLNKQFKQDRYTWWVVASFMLQAKSAAHESTKQLQLTLAERTAEMALKEGRLTNTEELRIYLEVLELQGKHDFMLEVLLADGPLAEKIQNDCDLISQRIDLMIKTGDYAQACKAAEQALESRDNWADYKLYAEAVVATLGQTGASESYASAAIANFDRWACQRGRARAANLACIDLATRLHEAGHSDVADKVIGPVGERIWSYIDAFMAKAICYSDIMNYICAHAKRAAAQQLALSVIDFHTKQLEQRLSSARTNALLHDEDAAQAWVCLERIRYLMQALVDDTDSERWIAGVETMLPFALDSDEAEQKQPACSDMVLIASQRIVQAAFLAYSEPAQHSLLCLALFKALCVLEAGIKLNSDQFLLKLHAIRLYLYLSCYERARALYDTLNIKHIQHDTLGFLINGHGMALGCFAPDLALCYDGVSFYDRAEARIPRELESAYGNGTYSNITDFLAFQDNLVHSMQRECTHRHALRGEVFEHGGSKDVLAQWGEADVVSIAHTDATIDALNDNRDVGVMGLLTPIEMTRWNLEIMTRPVPLQGSNWLKIFSLVPQIMHYIVCADAAQLDMRSKELLAVIDQAGQSVSSHDILLARGICQIATLYLSALSGNECFEQQLTGLADLICSNIPQELPAGSSSRDLASVALSAIRNAAAATELFTYALSAKHALTAQRLPSFAKLCGLRLSQVRKTALKLMNEMRVWTDKQALECIDLQWQSREGDLLASIADFVFDRCKATSASTARSCASSWLKSVKSMDGVYNYVLMTLPALLHSTDESWFEPLPPNDIDVDAAQLMPLPGEDQNEDYFEDTWGDLNKKSLLK
ncbi:mitochondrial distribution and morphology [Coemansia sp. RSA 2322]|nr:mitochondrial distribution and morphology [Coemansia sp. RSA 2322]